jgi:hypothetical protein
MDTAFGGLLPHLAAGHNGRRFFFNLRADQDLSDLTTTMISNDQSFEFGNVKTLHTWRLR